MKLRRRRRSVFRFVPVFLLVFALLPASDEEPEFPYGDFEEVDQFYATLACRF